jgi:hypothetical protein
MNLEGFLVSLVRITAKKPSCFFSISMWILLAEIKAISIPEKNAENTKDKIMMMPAVPTTCFDYPVGVVQTSFDRFF